MDCNDVIQSAVTNLSEYIPGLKARIVAGDNIEFKFRKKTFRLPFLFQNRLTRNFLLQLELNAGGRETVDNSGDARLIMTDSIRREDAMKLRDLGFMFLDSHGNCCLDSNEFFLYILSPAKPGASQLSSDRAFKKTGLKLLAAFLADTSLVARNYREISKISGCSMGSIKEVFEDLKARGFLKVLRGKRVLTRMGQLFDSWIERFNEVLRPSLLIGRYDFVSPDDFAQWKERVASIQKPLYLGGESGAEILTDFFKAQDITVYADEEDRIEIIKTLRLKPAKDGCVLLMTRFWNEFFGESIPLPVTADNCHLISAPHFIIYADLLSDESSRNEEAAKEIYEQYLANKYR